MTKKMWAAVIGVIILMIVASGIVIYFKLGGFVKTGATDVQQEAVEFQVYDENGKAVKFSEFEGEPVVINFWASWAEPSQRELPLFEDAYKEYGNEVQFMMIDFSGANDETQEKGAAFIKDNGYTFPVFYDNDKNAGTAYRVMSIPLTYFVNEEGIIVKEVKGIMDETMMQEGIKAITE